MSREKADAPASFSCRILDLGFRGGGGALPAPIDFTRRHEGACALEIPPVRAVGQVAEPPRVGCGLRGNPYLANV